MAASGITAAVLLVVTAVFDNETIAAGLFTYPAEHLSGLRIGLAPVEDFSYALCAAFLVPAVYTLRDAVDRVSVNTPIDIYTRQNLWPLPWYLRKHPAVRWYVNGVPPEAGAAAVVLMTPEVASDVKNEIGRKPRPIDDRIAKLNSWVDSNAFVRKPASGDSLRVADVSQLALDHESHHLLTATIRRFDLARQPFVVA